jgi:hypothetical protein
MALHGVTYFLGCHLTRSYNGLPHGILHVFYTILYENEFQNPQILMDTLEIT